MLDLEGRLQAVGEFPTFGAGAAHRLGLAGLPDLIAHHRIDRAIVEDAQSMPRQGTASTFRYGRAVGAVEGALTALQVPIAFIRPAVWKRHFALGAGDKGKARALAAQRWPTHEAAFTRVKDQHRAEAALLGVFYLERGRSP